jgi:hypothetical protein
MVSTAMRAFLGRLVRQQNAAGNVADGQQRGIGRFLLFVDLDEAALVLLDFGVFQTEVVKARHAPDGNQHAVVKFLLLDLSGPSVTTRIFFPLVDIW